MKEIISDTGVEVQERTNRTGMGKCLGNYKRLLTT